MNWKEIVGAIAAGWLVFKTWWSRISPIISPIVKEIEEDALTGVINKADRKKIAMDTVNALQTAGVIKLNWIEKLLVSWVIDYIAQRLPDWEVSSTIQNVLAQVEAAKPKA